MGKDRLLLSRDHREEKLPVGKILEAMAHVGDRQPVRRPIAGTGGEEPPIDREHTQDPAKQEPPADEKPTDYTIEIMPMEIM